MKELFEKNQMSHENWLKEYCEKHNLDYVMTSMVFREVGKSIAQDIIGDKANT